MCFSAHQRTIEGEELTDDQKAFLDNNVRAVLNALSGYPAFQQAQFANRLQAYVEASPYKVPINFASDPRNGSNCARIEKRLFWVDSWGVLNSVSLLSRSYRSNSSTTSCW